MARHALAIGASLDAARVEERDAERMAAALHGRRFEVDLRCGARATRDGILAGYRALIERVREGDAAVLYYSGHGGVVLDPEAPPPGARVQARRFQFLAPTDYTPASQSGGVFRGVSAWELSALLAELTARTGNVTVILDCCYASGLSRRHGAAPARAVEPQTWATLAAHLDDVRARFGPIGAPGPIGNPRAVRIVACGDWQTATQTTGADGERLGLFTHALLATLAEIGEAPVSWAAAIAAIRARVLRTISTQRPMVEGPARRRLFDVAEDDAAPLAVERNQEEDGDEDVQGGTGAEAGAGGRGGAGAEAGGGAAAGERRARAGGDAEAGAAGEGCTGGGAAADERRARAGGDAEAGAAGAEGGAGGGGAAAGERRARAGGPSRATVRLGGGRITGVTAGDIYGVTALGAPGFAASTALARVRVERVSALHSIARPIDPATLPDELPTGALAWPLERALPRRAVWIEAPDEQRAAIVAAVAASVRLRVATPPCRRVVGQLHATAAGALDVRLPGGRRLDPGADPWTLPRAVRRIDQLAAAAALLELEADHDHDHDHDRAHALPTDELDLAWGIVTAGGARLPQPAHGAAITPGTRIYIEVRNDAAAPRWVHLFNLGVAGVIAPLSDFAPAGLRLAPGHSELVGIGPDPRAPHPGIVVAWPDELAPDAPGVDALIAIVTDRAVELRALATDGARARNAAQLRGSPLQRLLGQLHDGGTRGTASGAAAERFLVARRSYVIDPRA